MEEAEAAIVLARADRDAARQLLALLTIGCRALARFEEERAFLFGIGIPGEFLPTVAISAAMISPDGAAGLFHFF
jgi:hypothetical protein